MWWVWNTHRSGICGSPISVAKSFRGGRSSIRLNLLAKRWMTEQDSSRPSVIDLKLISRDA